MAHEVTYEQRSTFDYYAICRCGWTADPKKVYRTRDQIEDEVMKHDRIVERARHHLRRANPSLKAERDYYASMAENPAVPERDRLLWQQLADGLNSRIGKALAEQDHPMLFLLESE